MTQVIKSADFSVNTNTEVKFTVLVEFISRKDGSVVKSREDVRFGRFNSMGAIKSHISSMDDTFGGLGTTYTRHTLLEVIKA